MGSRRQLASIVRCSCGGGEMPPFVPGGSSAQQTSSPVVSTSMSAQSSGVTMSCADSSRATPSHARYRARRQRTGERHRAVASRARASAAAPPPPAVARPLPREPSGGPWASGRCAADADRGGSRSRCGSLRYAMTAFSYLGTLARPCRAPGATLWREKRLLQRQRDHIADIGHRPVGQSHRINNRALAARVEPGASPQLLQPN